MGRCHKRGELTTNHSLSILTLFRDKKVSYCKQIARRVSIRVRPCENFLHIMQFGCCFLRGGPGIEAWLTLRNTLLFRVSSVITLAHPSTSSCFKIQTVVFDTHHPESGITPNFISSTKFWSLFLHSFQFTHASSSPSSPLALPVVPSLFHPKLKVYLFHKSFPSQNVNFVHNFR